MTRHEFISQLREALAGEVPQSVIETNVRFYDGYINDETAKGRSESDIFRELGDPRLIARTIMDTWQGDKSSVDEDDSDSYNETYDTGGYTDYSSGSYASPFEYEQAPYERNEERGNGSRFGNHTVHHFELKGWMVTVIILAIIILIFLFLFWILTMVLHLTFAIVTSRLFWIIVLVCILVALFRRKR